MPKSNLATTTLRSITGLTEKLTAAIAELKAIEQSILSSTSIEASKAPAKRGPKPKVAAVKDPKASVPAKKAPATKVSKAPVEAKAGRRGGIKEQIVGALQKAGVKGISVKDLAEKLSLKPANVHVWFATTGKSVGVEKLAPGVYRLKA